MITELKPCPFCGGEARFDDDHPVFRNRMLIGCSECNAEVEPLVRFKFSKSDQIALWNTRAAPLKEGGFKVKQLEWDGRLAFSPIGNYFIGKFPKDHFYKYFVSLGPVNFGDSHTLDEAKAAAQADFERRILGSLEGGVMDILTDIKPHLHPWLAALHIAERAAVSCPPDIDDKAYWRHEIKALDAILGKLNALLRKPDGEVG